MVLFDSIRPARSRYTQMAEAFGKFWGRTSLEVLRRACSQRSRRVDLAASPLGQLAAAVSGLAAPFVAGAILLAAKAITAFALARQLTTGAVSAGFK